MLIHVYTNIIHILKEIKRIGPTIQRNANADREASLVTNRVGVVLEGFHLNRLYISLV